MVGGIPVFCARKIWKEKTRLRNANFGPFAHLLAKIKVINLFKATKVTFRERNSQKCKIEAILHSSAAKKPSRFSRFLKKNSPEVVPNSDSSYKYAEMDIFNEW